MKKFIFNVQKQVLEDCYCKYIVNYTNGQSFTQRTYDFYIPKTVEDFIRTAKEEVMEDRHIGPLRYTCTNYSMGGK